VSPDISVKGNVLSTCMISSIERDSKTVTRYTKTLTVDTGMEEKDSCKIRRIEKNMNVNESV